ncbi:MAG: hypothetical protein ACI4T6_05285, partial [Candidatus Flemingiibacterium sp.]
DEFRNIVRHACETRAKTHSEIMHIPGRELLTGPRGLSGDFVHPNVEGVREIADRLGEILERETK